MRSERYSVPGSELALGRGQIARPRVARLRRPERRDQQDLGALVRPWAVLDAARDDVEVAGAQFDVALAELDREPAAHDEEEVVRLRMAVPDELALRLRDHQLVVVQR